MPVRRPAVLVLQRGEAAGLSDAIRRAEHAERLLGDELVVEAIAALRSTAYEAWTLAATPDQREQIWVFHKLVDRFEKHLKTVIEGGKIEAANLAEEKRRSLFQKLNIIGGDPE